MSELQTIELKIKVVLRHTKGNFVTRRNLIKAIKLTSDPETLVVGKSEYAVMEWEIKET